MDEEAILEQAVKVFQLGFTALAEGVFAFRKRLVELGYSVDEIPELERAALVAYGAQAGVK